MLVLAWAQDRVGLYMDVSRPLPGRVHLQYSTTPATVREGCLADGATPIAILQDRSRPGSQSGMGTDL